MNQQQWRQKAYDEWVGRTTGGRANIDQAYGDNARRATERARQNWITPTLPSHIPPRNEPKAPRGTITPRTSGEPWFPFVDRWLASVPRWMLWCLALLGALIGYGYRLETAGTGGAFGYALMGGVAGLLLLPVLALALKLVLAAVILAVFGTVLYALLSAMGS